MAFFAACGILAIIFAVIYLVFIFIGFLSDLQDSVKENKKCLSELRTNLYSTNDRLALMEQTKKGKK